jgi:hypothetical protein
MYCARCGKENAENAQFCGSCGKAMPQPCAAAEAKTCGLAIASLVLGILGFLCGLSAIPGLILGIMALRRINRSAGRLRGKGLATGGIVTSGVALVMLILAAMLMPALARPRAEARNAVSARNLHIIGIALEMYQTDWGSQYPPSLAELCPDYLRDESILVDPGDKAPVRLGNRGLRCSYEFVGSLPAGRLRRGVIVCYTRTGINPAGRTVLRADGSVRFVQEETLHDPTMPPDVSLRDSYEVVVEALGVSLTPERDAELRKFYEVEH